MELVNRLRTRVMEYWKAIEFSKRHSRPRSQSDMYGLIYDAFAEYVCKEHGEDVWQEIRNLAGVETSVFLSHQIYQDAILIRMVKKTHQLLGCTEDELIEGMGHYFIKFLREIGYGEVLGQLGRQLRDFVNGLDNLHAYMKLSYPQMRAPSFLCIGESDSGLQLEYRSKRKSYIFYIVGQLKAIAKIYYQIDLKVEVIKRDVFFDTLHVTYDLKFDNSAKKEINPLALRHVYRMPAVSSAFLYKIFPFLIMFDDEMTIKSVGDTLRVEKINFAHDRSMKTHDSMNFQLWPGLLDKKMNEVFEVIRPLAQFQFAVIKARQNNIFELATLEPIAYIFEKLPPKSLKEDEEDSAEAVDEADLEVLHLRGQMYSMPDWNAILFLANPVLEDLTHMNGMRLCTSDLSPFDFSRDLLLDTCQMTNTLKDALEKNDIQTTAMEKTLSETQNKMEQSENLLSSMMPQAFIDQVKAGIDPSGVCEMLEEVSILFSSIPDFLNILSSCEGMEIVNLLSGVFGYFDVLCDVNKIFKLETYEDGFVAVSGAPEPVEDHVNRIADMALDMRDAARFVKDPRSKEGEPDQMIQIRIGCHTGRIVAGIVGNKAPRYCLFGDTMNTSSRMMTSGAGGDICISSEYKESLPVDFVTEERDPISVKGKGEMKTFFLKGKNMREPPEKDTNLVVAEEYGNRFRTNAHKVAICHGVRIEDKLDNLIAEAKANGYMSTNNEAKPH